MTLKHLVRLVSFGLLAVPLVARVSGAERKPAPLATGPKVSYFKEVLPLFQANCQGCHQPAKLSGGYLMTEFKSLFAGGGSKKPAIVPGAAEKSNLVKLITPQGDKAAMPQGKPPLRAEEIALVARWIAQGAKDDTAAFARARFDAEHPPVYTRPPVITSLDYAPDGKTIAVSGFNEVLVVDATDGKLVGRLIGKSERIQSLKFSPNGKLLVAVGGQPGRAGEVQVWEVAARKQLLAHTVGADTLYGVSWSPDSTQVAFGCPDNVVRAIAVADGQQTLFMGSHNDWPLATIWSVDGSHVVSVGRDMTTKLTEVATQRFVDNVSSITPGALKGGLQAVARHPSRDEIVLGGADGAPKVYRMFRQVARAIGDDSNLIKNFPALKGRVFGVAVSKDGKRIAAVSSLDGKGEVAVFGYEFDTNLSDRIKAIMAKVASSRSAAEAQELEKFHTEGVKQFAKITVDAGSQYCVAFAPDGKTLAAAGADGSIRVLDTETLQPVSSFSPAPVTTVAPVKVAGGGGVKATKTSQLPGSTTSLKVVALEVQPKAVQLASKFDYTQLIVTAKLASGDRVDVTQKIAATFSAPVAQVNDRGFVTPIADGTATLKVTFGGKTATMPVAVRGAKAAAKVNFTRDVNPILSRMGCNAGTCHGSQQGKQGFKLSLRGYDPIEDVRALTDDLEQRRVNVASPDDSLMLLKATGQVPHVGAQVFRKDDPYYFIIRHWIADGAKLDLSVPRVARIAVTPTDPVIQTLGAKQQIRVLATYTDGAMRDVTREAFIESGNTEVATADRDGRMTSVRRGEAPVLARYEGAYAAATVTVMGDRSGFVWQQPESWGRVDELVARKWQRMKIQPSNLATDAEFLRRVYLDLTGLPPTADGVRAFMADARSARAKRDEVVDKLVGSKEYVEFWTNKWADLLQVNRKFLDVDGARAFRQWIRTEIEQNTPYDQLARKVITAKGSNRENPAAAYYKILRQPDALMENTTHLFLGVRFNCNKCHDHPFERWTQNQYYELSAFFAQVALKDDPMSGGRRVGGTAVEGSKALYEEVYDNATGEMPHQRTGQPATVQFPFESKHAADEKATRRERLAAWLTSTDNQYFAKSYVNRLWGYLFGLGIIEPIDDIRAGNPATNPELLDYLTQEFLKSGFDARAMLKLITKSRTYQLAVAVNKWNQEDKLNFSHALARRLPAEVLYDALHTVTGAPSKFPGLPAGTRAAELPDSGVELPSGFLTTFGRPVRESACECERTSGLQLGPVMALVSGPVIADAIADANNAVSKLVASEPDDRKVINELFLRVLNRPATDKEISITLTAMGRIEEDHTRLIAARDQREREWASQTPQLEKQRAEAIAKAQQELEAFKQQQAPILAQREVEKAARTVQLETELKLFEAQRLPAKLVELKATAAGSAPWMKLDPKNLRATANVTLTRQDDLSVLAGGPNLKSVYTVVTDTDLKDIQAVRLEVIADGRFPASGPGRAGDGNFVLTEFELRAAPKSNPAAARRIMLRKAKASFSQQEFPVERAIDLDVSGAGGWGLSPTTGATHWATFETAEPVGFDGGTVLTFTLNHNFNGNMYQLGRFRLSVTTKANPGLSVAEEYATIVAAAQPTAQQTETLRKYFRRVDGDWRNRITALNQSRAPLPKDAKLQEHEDALAYAIRVIVVDGLLLQHRADAEASTRQLQNKRLTAMQDLTWALINTPSFLFNR